MDGRITGGSVTFLKRVNRGNYEHEEASVKLDFAMNEDGTDHTTVLGRAQAEAKVGALVQLGLMKVEVAPVAPSAPATAQSTASTTGKGRTKAAASAAKEEPDADDPLAAAPSPTATDAAVSTQGDDPLGSVSGLTASTPSTDDLTAQREVSDNDLQTALAKKNEALIKAHGPQGTMKIRDLMGRFVAPGKTVREIPQSDRASFLAQLDAL